MTRTTGAPVVRSALLGSRPDPTEPIRIGFQIREQAVAWPDLMAPGERTRP
ncbi:MAG: hypothetical protein ABI628_03065 [Chloroflexota bacterium]